jgi:two-component system, OmpR family, response regulator
MTRGRVLVVDDEPGVARALSNALALEGFWVRTSNTATAALQECDEHSFDLIVADFVMPDLDGVELLRRVRQRQPMIRSILISGKLSPDVSEDAVRAELKGAVECDLYLHKPVRTDRLAKEIDDLLARPALATEWPAVAKRAMAMARVPAAQATAASRKVRRVGRRRKKK